ncbi:MAG: aldehyde ferredoxin oxidoreductase N-terminal domain-containing protein, partial [Clostridia bacterium]
MATKYGAYAGKVLLINLSDQSYREYPLNDSDRKIFIGGKILAARIINDFITGPIDPLGKDNILVITTGPLSNTNAPSSSRFNISTISPLTGILTSSNCGGNFGIRLKKAGYDGLIITG